MDIYRKYKELLKKYGKQGWWPLVMDKDGTLGCVYHKGDYTYPHNDEEIFEICVGAILTQNTAWKNVEKALVLLKKNDMLDPTKIIRNDIKEYIRPAGYFNQKEKKLKIFSEFFLKKKGVPSRDELLGLWGIGKETADSILLYAYNYPIFVVDAYTRRLFSFGKDVEYDEIREEFENDLPKDHKIYQEFHALIVEEGKNRA